MAFNCWKCGSPLQGLILPMSRRENCIGCRAEQHVCIMCVNFDQGLRLSDSGAANCMEERAEPPKDIETANFCDYFSPAEGLLGYSHCGQTAAQKQSLDALAELFGEQPSIASDAAENATASISAEGADNAVSQAELELRQLFGE